MRVPLVLVASAVLVSVVALGGAFAAQQNPRGAPEPPPPPGPITAITLPLPLPAVGNIDLVRRWHFGRIQAAEMTGGPEVILSIRTEDGQVHRITGPGAPLGEFARRSNWLTAPDNARPGRADYVERMIAFDVDENGVLIAMISLEPMNRDRNRLRRALTR